MPRLPIDYSKSVIYKIYSNDQDVNEIYIGSTTNFRKRKHKHKCLSLNKNNQNTNEYNRYVYEYINNNGGWNSFNMTILERYDCNNKIELQTREAYYIKHLNATLNKQIPCRTSKQYRIDNKDKIIQYRIDNRDKFIQYRIDNKDKINNYLTSKVMCNCGSIISKRNISAHKKSDYHKNKINNPFHYTNL